MKRLRSLTTAFVFVSGLETNSVAAFSAPVPQNNGLSKVEAGGVRRFKEFDKLCKTCPTLLQPRIATLEEMIMGLSVEERDELLVNVARRVEHENAVDSSSDAPHIQTAQDVYRFQTGVDADEPKRPADMDDSSRDEETSARKKLKKEKEKVVDKDKDWAKMDKTLCKFDATKGKLARTRRLIGQTKHLLAGNREALLVDSDTTDPSVYHAVDKLATMSRAELKMQRLKYQAQEAEYERKLAKYRVKLYGATIKLADSEEQEPVAAG